jgi:hypothetical protein
MHKKDGNKNTLKRLLNTWGTERVHIFPSSGLSIEAPKVIDMPRIQDVNSIKITQPIRSRPSDLLDMYGPS